MRQLTLLNIRLDVRSPELQFLKGGCCFVCGAVGRKSEILQGGAAVFVGFSKGVRFTEGFSSLLRPMFSCPPTSKIIRLCSCFGHLRVSGVKKKDFAPE